MASLLDLDVEMFLTQVLQFLRLVVYRVLVNVLSADIWHVVDAHHFQVIGDSVADEDGMSFGIEVLFVDGYLLEVRFGC